MPKLDEQISTLQQKLSLLKLRQQRLDARRHAGAALRQRKDDTRRKILLGGLILDKMREGTLQGTVVESWLAQGLTRDADRALFDLPPLAAVDTATVDTAPSRRAATDEFESLPGGERDHGNGVG